MVQCIGIRHEDKYLMERRVPLTPKDIEKLTSKLSVRFCVQSSPKRIFTDEEFKLSGAEITSDTPDCPIIIGVKEMPLEVFKHGKTYMFFSHVIKGQPYNMPMLKRMMELKCNLIDYEKVEDDLNKRLIFFGRHAGLAGMLNTLWSLGQQYRLLGIETPFTKIKQSHTYPSLADALIDVEKVGMHIATHGLDKRISPFIIAFTGYGNVSNGAQDIIDLLPVKEIFPEQIPELSQRKDLPDNIIYKTVFKEKDIAERIDGKPFDLEDYYENPSLHKDKFQQYVPYLNCIVNGMYWDKRYHRIVTKSLLKELFSKGRPRLTVIGDISCDPNGAIECTHKGTEIQEPVFVYHPLTDTHSMGFNTNGVLVMAVDILPSELPKESSESFSAALRPFIGSLAETDFSKPFDELSLASPLKKALILHNGELTKRFAYLSEHLKK